MFLGIYEFLKFKILPLSKNLKRFQNTAPLKYTEKQIIHSVHPSPISAGGMREGMGGGGAELTKI